MPEPKRSLATTQQNPFLDLLLTILGTIILSGLLYGVTSFLSYFLSVVFSLKDHPNITAVFKVIDNGAPILLLGVGILAGIFNFFDARKAARARQATQRVVAALNEIQDQTPGQNIAEISTKKVAESLKDTKISEDQLARLVEQRKQQLLIDDEYFREELSSLIVDYLQPLPRNAKRLFEPLSCESAYCSQPRITYF